MLFWYINRLPLTIKNLFHWILLKSMEILLKGLNNILKKRFKKSRNQTSIRGGDVDVK